MATASPWRRSHSGWSARPAALERVGQRVAVVEDHPPVALALVGGHHLGLDRHAARHLLVDVGLRAGAARPRRRTSPSPPGRRPTPRAAACRGSRYRTGRRLGCQNAPTRFLPSGRFTPVFPPMAASTCPRQRRGDVHVRRPPVVRGGREPGHVGDDAAPDGHHHVGPGEAYPGEAAAQFLHRGQRLGRLPFGHGPDLEGQAGIEVGQPTRRIDDRLGDHEGLFRRRGHEAGQLVADPPPDENGIGTGPEVDRDLPHQGRTRAPSSSMIRAATSSGLQLVHVDRLVRHLRVERAADGIEQRAGLSRGPRRGGGGPRRRRPAPPGWPGGPAARSRGRRHAGGPGSPGAGRRRRRRRPPPDRSGCRRRGALRPRRP